MNKLKASKFIFILTLVLALIFFFLLLVPDIRNNTIARLGMWLGLISQLLLAISMFFTIRKLKNGE